MNLLNFTHFSDKLPFKNVAHLKLTGKEVTVSDIYKSIGYIAQDRYNSCWDWIPSSATIADLRIMRDVIKKAIALNKVMTDIIITTKSCSFHSKNLSQSQLKHMLNCVNAFLSDLQLTSRPVELGGKIVK